jgi:hypothetical protein
MEPPLPLPNLILSPTLGQVGENDYLRRWAV